MVVKRTTRSQFLVVLTHFLVVEDTQILLPWEYSIGHLCLYKYCCNISIEFYGIPFFPGHPGLNDDMGKTELFGSITLNTIFSIHFSG